jgi:hypothetical protein
MVKSLYLRAFAARLAAIPATGTMPGGARHEKTQGSMTPEAVRPKSMVFRLFW